MPLYDIKYINEDCILALWKIEESAKKLHRMVHLMPRDEKIYARFVRENRKQEWLASRLLIQTILEENISIIYNAQGKPHVFGMEWEISVSHKKDYVGIILGRDMDVAIDIELLSYRVEKIYQKFLHKNEIINISGSDRNYHLHLLWCAKECLIKLSGRKNIDLIKEIYIYPFDIHDSSFFGKFKKLDKNEKIYKFNHQKFNDNYLMVWVAKPQPPDISNINKFMIK